MSLYCDCDTPQFLPTGGGGYICETCEKPINTGKMSVVGNPEPGPSVLNIGARTGAERRMSTRIPCPHCHELTAVPIGAASLLANCGQCGKPLAATPIESGFDEPAAPPRESPHEGPVPGAPPPVPRNPFDTEIASCAKCAECGCLIAHDGEKWVHTTLLNDPGHKARPAECGLQPVSNPIRGALNQENMIANPDAQSWARYFLQTIAEIEEREGKPICDPKFFDEGWLHSWFANAMCAQMDWDSKRHREELEKLQLIIRLANLCGAHIGGEQQLTCPICELEACDAIGTRIPLWERLVLIAFLFICFSGMGVLLLWAGDRIFNYGAN